MALESDDAAGSKAAVAAILPERAPVMDQVVSITPSQKIADSRLVDRPAVHPGWFSADQLSAVPMHSDDDMEADVRFRSFVQLIRTAGALDRAACETLADLGLTAGAFFALLELADASPTGLAPSELARRLAVARRTATLYVDILGRNGWVERSAHPDDRRMVLAHLTADGEHLVAELADAYKRRLARLIGELTPLQAERMRQLLTLIPLTPEAVAACAIDSIAK